MWAKTLACKQPYRQNPRHYRASYHRLAVERVHSVFVHSISCLPFGSSFKHTMFSMTVEGQWQYSLVKRKPPSLIYSFSDFILISSHFHSDALCTCTWELHFCQLATTVEIIYDCERTSFRLGQLYSTHLAIPFSFSYFQVHCGCWVTTVVIFSPTSCSCFCSRSQCTTSSNYVLFCLSR